MNRCTHRFWPLAAAALACALAAPAQAEVSSDWPRNLNFEANDASHMKSTPARQGRRFSDTRIERGTVDILSTRDARLNGQPVSIAVGARVRSERNRLVRLNDLVGQRHVVNYRLDNRGYISEIWILTEGERAQLLPSEESRMKSGIRASRSTKPEYQPGVPFNERPKFPGNQF